MEVSSVSQNLSIFSLISGADIIVKLVMLILISFSFWSWKIFIEKILLLNQMEKLANKFEKIFWSGQALDQLYDKVRGRVNHPIANIFVAAIYEFNKQNIKEVLDKLSFISIGVKERIYQAMEVAKNKEINFLEKNISFLATTGSTAPFIGLFGTVWGIMNSFKSIAAAKNATLAVVAPGIAEALLATAIGLFAAIPAVIFYNILANKLNRFDSRLENFSVELGSLLTSEIDKSTK